MRKNEMKPTTTQKIPADKNTNLTSSSKERVNDPQAKQNEIMNLLEEIQLHANIMNGIIHVEDNVKKNERYINVHEIKEVRYRRSKKNKESPKMTLGLNKASGFGVQKKLWLYLYGINRDVTEEKSLTI